MEGLSWLFPYGVDKEAEQLAAPQEGICYVDQIYLYGRH
jgi:hypothetical protein